MVCNQLTPDGSKQVAIENAAAATVAELRGGRVTPGVYDLSRALQIGDATGWSGTRAVVLQVTEGADGSWQRPFDGIIGIRRARELS